MLLCAGEPGNRAALPSASIMIRQPMQRITQMQASDIDIYRNQIRKTNEEITRLLAKHTGHPVEKISKDILRPKYFTPEGKEESPDRGRPGLGPPVTQPSCAIFAEAVEYGLIDNVLNVDDAKVKRAIKAGMKI